MSEFDPIDSWFEKAFRIRKQKASKTAQGTRRDSARASSGSPPKNRGGVSLSSSAKSKNIKSVIKKAPEVMVKITGSSKGLSSVKHHLDYISRNGDVELVNEQGESIKGSSDLRDLKQHLKAEQIPDDGKKREFLHVIFSMPKDTPEKEMKEAVANFCKEEFSNRRYVMAFHDDTDHTHMHVCVGTRDIDRADEPRLSPRKEDLFRWRVGFAEKLRGESIEAAASPRVARFNFRKPENFTLRQIRADNPESNVYNKVRADNKAIERIIRANTKPQNAFIGALRPPRTPTVYEHLKTALNESLATNTRPVNPAANRIESIRIEGLDKWSKVASNLIKSGETDLVKSVNEIIAKGNVDPVTAMQEFYDAEQQKKTQEKDDHSH